MMDNEKIEEIENISDEEVINFFTSDSLRMYIKSISVYPLLSAEGQKEAWAKGDRTTLINSNLRLVVKVAYYYAKSLKHLNILDIIQEGNIGLMRAVETYNPEKGAFSTHAVPWIRQGITRAKYGQDKTIRLPIHVNLLIGKYNRLLQDASQRGINLTEEEIMASLKITPAQYASLKCALGQRTISINLPINDDNDSELADIIPDENSSNYENVLDTIVSDDLKKVLKSILTPLEYYVLHERWLGDEEKTLEEVGKAFHITRERVRQIEKKALTIAKKYIKEDSSVYLSAYQRLKEKGYIEKYKTTPISPYDIVKYIYLENDLLSLEKKMYKLIFLSGYAYSMDDVANLLNITLKEAKEICTSLTKKINAKFQDVAAYNDFKDNILKAWKTAIFTNYFMSQQLAQENPINYDYLDEKYASLSLEEVLQYFEDINYTLKENELVLLQNFFSAPREQILPGEEIEKDINTTIYYADYNYLSPNLYRTFLTNRKEFNEEQQLYLEAYVFNVIPKMTFDQTYPNSMVKKQRKYLINKLEKLYYHVNYKFVSNKEKWLEIKTNFSDKFSEQNIQILDLYFGVNGPEHTRREIAEIFNISEDEVRGIINQLIYKCKKIYCGIDYKSEINKQLYLSYIKEGKVHLEGKTYYILIYYLDKNMSVRDIAKLYQLTEDCINNLIDKTIFDIDCYRFGIDPSQFKEVISPTLLSEVLSDIHVPIKQREKDIICHLFSLFAYPYMSIDDLATYYDETPNNIRQSYYNAIINIQKYLRREIAGYLDFTLEIEPYLRYFCPPDRAKLVDYYQNHMSVLDMAEKYNMDWEWGDNILRRIHLELRGLKENSGFHFDYDYYAHNFTNDDIPYYGDKVLAKKIFDLYYGMDGRERLSSSKIIKELGLNYSQRVVENIITDVKIAFGRYSEGIVYKKQYTTADVYDYFISNIEYMNQTKRDIYNNFLNNGKKAEMLPNTILNDLIMASDPQAFVLGRASKKDAMKLLERYGIYLKSKTVRSLEAMFDIHKEDLLTEEEVKQVYNLLYNLDLEMKKRDIYSRIPTNIKRGIFF